VKDENETPGGGKRNPSSCLGPADAVVNLAWFWVVPIREKQGGGKRTGREPKGSGKKGERKAVSREEKKGICGVNHNERQVQNWGGGGGKWKR